MSATPSSKRLTSADKDIAIEAVPAVEIDASCRVPVLLLFISAATWLLVASVLGILASIKFHKASFLGDSAWLTYGRIHPASLNSLIYGFAIPAGLGVAAWIVSHLGRTKLAMAPLVVAGGIAWNLGVTLGVLGIFMGDSTGYEWLELPRYSSGILFFAYLAIGLGLMVTFRLRRERQFYISQWFVLAAAFWFPWIYSTAQLLLVVKPVRGVMQTIINWWYVNNLTTIWLGFIGLATIFYFIPKLKNRPLSSHYTAVFAFWALAIFGSWAGIPAGSPLPAWIPALSTTAAVFTIIPILAVALNIRGTLTAPQNGKGETSSLLKFFKFGAIAYVLAGLIAAIGSIPKVSEITHFTWLLPAQVQLLVYGFFAMVMFGAIYYITPRLLQAEVCAKGIKIHFWLAMLGVVIYVVALGVGGVKQGLELNQPGSKLDFLGVLKTTIPFLRASTMGDLLMALGNLIFLLNLVGLLVKVIRNSASTALLTNNKTAGVRS